MRTALRAVGALLGAVGLVTGAVAVPPASAAPTAVFACPNSEYLGPGDVETYNHYTFTNDGKGRPYRAVAPYGTLIEHTADRDSCETTVGHYAGQGAGYDGGHMIASFLNGPSRRENLVPMQGTTLNRVSYLNFERAVGRCLEQHGSANVEYEITAAYTNSTDHRIDLTPVTVSPKLTVNFQGSQHQIQQTFPNRVLTPNERTELLQDLDRQAAAAGCPRHGSNTAESHTPPA
ncbi:DNA/RNA non-specific endonuclease [Streptomyces sp. NPDC021354]|uniref:DNA/RNA non-specific endonuclease n=1 Tax=Streptomyces sp. NPDC021354 TaxID=3154793 RepID=UPI0033C07222